MHHWDVLFGVGRLAASALISRGTFMWSRSGTPAQGTWQERILPMRDSFATDEARNRAEDYTMVGFAHS